MQWLKLSIGLAVALSLANPAFSELAEPRDNPTVASGPACNELFTCLTAFRQDLERLRLIMG